MGDRMIVDDVELYLCDYLRRVLARVDVKVTNRFPDPMPSGFVVVVRYDGGDTGLATEDALVGVTVIGPSADVTGEKTGELARWVKHHVSYSWQDASGPVADVRALSGPVRLAGTERPERYMTATLRVVGRPI